MDRTLISGDDGGFTAEFLSDTPYVTAYTSGSTGAPKEIRLHKNDMRASAEATCRHFGLTERSKLVCPLSPQYIAGKMMIVRALVSGAHLEMIQPSSSPLEHWNGGYDIDLLPVVPAQVEAMLASPQQPRVRNLLIGGGALSHTLETRLTEAGVAAWVSYGMTETCSHVALRRAGCDTYETLSGIRVLTDSRKCLVIDIPTMSIGRIVTNDIAEVISPTRFRWRGRFDNVINSGGIKIHPEEDERLLAPYLCDTGAYYITSRVSARWGQEAVIVVTGTGMSDDEIIGICRQVLPRHHVPKAVIRDQAPTFTSSGKPIRRRF